MYQLNEAHSLFQGEEPDKRRAPAPGQIRKGDGGYFSGEKDMGAR